MRGASCCSPWTRAPPKPRWRGAGEDGQDQASLADAQRQLARSRELLAQGFVSQGAVDTNQAQFEAAQALVAADRAAIEAARLTASYARITAPAAGRLGAIASSPAARCRPTDHLVSITQLDPITCLQRAAAPPGRRVGGAEGRRRTGDRDHARGRRPAAAGPLQFVDNAVDPATGTVKVKAISTTRRQAVAGRVRQRGDDGTHDHRRGGHSAGRHHPGGARHDGLCGAGRQGGPRPVRAAAREGDDAAVSGVKAGERIVLDGRQNLRPGAPVVERAREAARGHRVQHPGAWQRPASIGATFGGSGGPRRQPGHHAANGARSDSVRGPAP